MNLIYNLLSKQECDCNACLVIPGTSYKYWCNLHKRDVSAKWEENSRLYRIKKNKWLLSVLENVELDDTTEWYVFEIKDQLRRDTK